MYKLLLFPYLSVVVSLFFGVPLFANAGLVIVGGDGGHFPVGSEKIISVCETAPKIVDNQIIEATNCQEKSVIKITEDGIYEDDMGAQYQSACVEVSEIEPAMKSVGGLAIYPRRTSCYYYLSKPAPVVDENVTSDKGRGLVPPVDEPVGLDETEKKPSQGLVPCGGKGQEQCQTCHVVMLMDNVIDWLITILSIIAGLIFAYAGILLVVSQGNTAAYEKAKTLFSNVIIGYTILLACWLIVDTVVKALLKDQVYGMWNQIQCVAQPKAVEAEKIYVYLDSPIANRAQLDAVFGTSYQQALFGGNVSVSTGDCSPANLQRLGMNSTQAQVFSCIAGPESGCNNNAQNSWSSARGVFQIVRGLNNQCHNLNLPKCVAAAQSSGYSATGSKLDCSTAFMGGTSASNPSRPRPGKEALFNACNAAASNLDCNVEAALCLYGDGGGYNHWLGERSKDHHRVQRACVASFSR